MPAQFTLPPDTRAVGTGNPPADMNGVVDAVTALGATFNVLNAAYAGGADPTGTSDSTGAVNAAFAALPATGGVIYFPPGTYRLNSTVTISMATGTQSVILMGAGQQATVLKYYGSGDAVRMLSTWSDARTGSQGSGVRSLTIDGTNASAGAAGLHVGDILRLAVQDVTIQRFEGAASKGLWLENTLKWTEQADVRAVLIQNQTQVTYGLSGAGTNSFGYGSWDFTMWEGLGGNHDGMVLTNGALLYHGHVRIRGNFNAATSALTNAVVRMTSGAGAAAIDSSQLDIQIECNDVGNGTTNKPTTFIFDATSGIFSCYGVLDFSRGGQTCTPSNLAIGQITFAGWISGDSSIAPGGGYNQWTYCSISLPQAVTGEIGGYHGSGFPTAVADMFTWTLSANLTANLTSTFYNGTKTLGVPQRVTIIIQQALSGGPYTVTWPTSGTPTTALPTIIWGNGAQPIQPTAAGAIAIYELETIDGATWYGSVGGAFDRSVYNSLVTGTSGVSAQNITGLSGLIAAGDYSLEMLLFYTPQATIGSTNTFGFTFGGTLSSMSLTGYCQQGATSTVSTITAIGSVFTTPTHVAGTGTATIQGTLHVTAPGTLQAVFTNTTSADLVNIEANSILTLRPLAA